MRTETRSLRNLPERLRILVANQVSLVAANLRGRIVRRKGRVVQACLQVIEAKFSRPPRKKDAHGVERRLVGDVISGTVGPLVPPGTRGSPQGFRRQPCSLPLKEKNAAGGGQRLVGDATFGEWSKVMW